MRCFAAISLSDALRGALGALVARWSARADGLRWCRPEQLHVTLWFLGEVKAADVASVCAAVAAAARSVEPFEISLTSVGCFPSARNPRVLWCGLDDPEQGCARWVAAAAPLLAALGFPAEARAFKPHITLARSNSPAGGASIGRVLEAAHPVGAASMHVEEFVLYESVLGPGGARYQAVHRAACRRE